MNHAHVVLLLDRDTSGLYKMTFHLDGQVSESSLSGGPGASLQIDHVSVAKRTLPPASSKLPFPELPEVSNV